MRRAIGISVHTGWAACVVVGGSPLEPEIVANEIVEVLGDAERFCYHHAAEMEPAAARERLAQLKEKAVSQARQALSRLMTSEVGVCALVAREGLTRDLAKVLASHAHIHAAEGCFYRDVFRDACGVPVRIVSPSTLDTTRVGKLARAPWGRDQKLAALAAWSALV
ncbi:MAG TPA: hypothetical protein VK437_10580 [Steroidobacteraceae bacterium]|nr:hypothetical protein [Steroidobacteraceae bacterium]